MKKTKKILTLRENVGKQDLENPSMPYILLATKPNEKDIELRITGIDGYFRLTPSQRKRLKEFL